MRRRTFARAVLGTGLTLGMGSTGCGARRSVSESRQDVVEAPALHQRLRIVTYNILADEVALPQRMPALFRALQQSQPDLIALQEVAPWFLNWVADTPWLREYHVAEIDGAPARPNGQFILSRLPIASARARRLSGRQGRSVLAARVDLGAGEQLLLATTHMESYLEDGPVRARQLDEIFELLALEGQDPKVCATVFCGDLNFGDGEAPDTAHLDPDFVDAWTALHPRDPGYTWDIEGSDMAAAGSFPGEPSRRLDRVLVRSDAWRPAAIEIIGDEPVTPGQRGLFPSDHFGLVAQLERVTPTTP